MPLHQDLGKTESVQCLSDHGWNLVTIPYQSLTTDIQQVRWGFLCGKLLVVIMEECSFRTKEEVIKSGETPSWQTCAWGCSTNASNTSDFLTVISGCLANAVKAEQPAMISFWWAKGHSRTNVSQKVIAKRGNLKFTEDAKWMQETPSSLNDWFLPTHLTVRRENRPAHRKLITTGEF